MNNKYHYHYEIIYQNTLKCWKYNIYFWSEKENHKLIFKSPEWFESKIRAVAAAMGHINLLKKGETLDDKKN